MTLYFAICEYSCPEIVFSLLPKWPPDGLITAFIISMLIGFNISIYLVWKFLVDEIKVADWHTDIPLEPLTLHNHTNLIDAKTYRWHYGFRHVIDLITAMLMASITLVPRQSPTMIPTLSTMDMCRLHIFCATVRFLITNPIISCKIMIQQIFFIPVQLLRELLHLLTEFFKHFRIFLRHNTMHTLSGFTTFAYSTLASVHENTMASFDMDSSFWVCDNLATGHICNDKKLFIGDLVPSIYIVGATTGTSEPTLMGTVQLRITDDNGKKHTFT